MNVSRLIITLAAVILREAKEVALRLLRCLAPSDEYFVEALGMVALCYPTDGFCYRKSG